MLYFDSNYILKCYLPEPDAHVVRALASQPVTKSCSRYGRVWSSAYRLQDAGAGDREEDGP